METPANRSVATTEWTLSVRRTARYFTLGEVGPGVRDCWVVCHGYGQLAESFLREFTAIASGGRLVVAPEGLSRFYIEGGTGPVGASWMTREGRETEIGDYLAFLDALYRDIQDRTAGSIARTTLLGFSQGAATVCRWAASETLAPGPSRVVLWGGGLPPDAELRGLASRLTQMPFTLVVGSRDRYVELAAVEREIGRFEAAGIPCDVLTFDGGHRLDRRVLQRLANR